MNLHRELWFASKGRRKIHCADYPHTYQSSHAKHVEIDQVSNIPPERDVDHGSCGQNSKQGPPFSDAIRDPG